MLLLLPGCQQVVDHAVSAAGAEPENKREHQIEGHAAGHAGQLGQHGSHDVTKIVIRNGIPRKPGIVGREAWRAQDGVDEGQLHRLFGPDRLRVGSPHNRQENEGQQEQHFNHCDQSQPGLDPGQQLLPVPVDSPGTQAKQHQNTEQQAAKIVLRQVQGSQQPEGIAPDQQRDNAGQGIAAISQSGE